MQSSSDDGEGYARGGVVRRCPICGRPTEQRWRPFCSKRCADVDLSRWLKGAYAVPVMGPDEDDESAPGEVSSRSPEPDGGSPEG